MDAPDASWLSISVEPQFGQHSLSLLGLLLGLLLLGLGLELELEFESGFDEDILVGFL